jgi:hypothetical protein
MKYGQQQYDFDEGTMFFGSPNQVFGIEHAPRNQAEKRSGWMLLIHPDFLWKTTLAKNIKQYEYFDYAVHEALFLSEKEEAVMNNIIENIQRNINPILINSARTLSLRNWKCYSIMPTGFITASF